jgi:hypothetical protein
VAVDVGERPEAAMLQFEQPVGVIERLPTPTSGIGL